MKLRSQDLTKSLAPSESLKQREDDHQYDHKLTTTENEEVVSPVPFLRGGKKNSFELLEGNPRRRRCVKAAALSPELG